MMASIASTAPCKLKGRRCAVFSIHVRAFSTGMARTLQKQRKNYTILSLAKGRGEIEFLTVEEKVLPLKDDGLGGGFLAKAGLLCC
jgi:hypothetical protein